jgi:hypothetical protein
MSGIAAVVFELGAVVMESPLPARTAFLDDIGRNPKLRDPSAALGFALSG